MAGELDQQISVRTRTDLPVDTGWLKADYATPKKMWGKVVYASPIARDGTVQTDDVITHKFVVRYRTDIDTNQEVFWAGVIYRIKATQPLSARRRFLVIHCTELRDADS